MNSPVIIIGAGGHAKVAIDLLQSLGRKILGALEINQELHGLKVNGVPVIGDCEAIEKFDPAEIELVNGIGSIRRPADHERVFLSFKERGYCFAKISHPSSIVARDVRCGEGGLIMAGAVIQTGTRLGVNTIVNTRASIDHDCIIGDHVHIAPGAVLSGEVIVGNCSHIGCGATIVQGVKLGNATVIGAGAVVLKNVPDGTTVVGVPARPLGR